MLKVHLNQSGEPGIFANAYVVETTHSPVVILSATDKTDSQDCESPEDLNLIVIRINEERTPRVRALPIIY
jgi:hypothetical protein